MPSQPRHWMYSAAQAGFSRKENAMDVLIQIMDLLEGLIPLFCYGMEG